MGMRTIKTPDGADWLVLDVHPSLAKALGIQPQLSPKLTETVGSPFSRAPSGSGWLSFRRVGTSCPSRS